MKSVVDIQKGHFRWTKDGEDVLRDVTLEVKDEESVAIVGPVGAGKSSLLYAIMNEMIKSSGTKRVSTNKIGFVAQQPWIQNDTLKNNILFGEPYEEEKYQRVL